MAVAPLKRGMTEEEFLHLPDDGRKYELVDGEPKAVPTSWEHDLIGGNIYSAIRPAAQGLGYMSTGQAGFWIAANIAGLCLGASQSAGRALVGYLAPADRHAEFFGLWGLAVKLASILGPLSYGAVTWITDNNHRTAMLITGGFFVLGLAVLASVDPERGRRAAVAAA